MIEISHEEDQPMVEISNDDQVLPDIDSAKVCIHLLLKTKKNTYIQKQKGRS